mmetsp:Transcript_6672/g.11823  ORF Transcript_6672/g.11823 Transcript_6672/m.11823 type:complete len:115 (+) Transcript_6672:1051-1395(+)
MANVAGEAILGEKPPLADELAAFGQAVASGDEKQVTMGRAALLAARNEHAVLDSAAIIGFFSSITKIVDLSGHYSDDLAKALDKMGKFLSAARSIRITLSRPFRAVYRILFASN